MKAVDAMIAWTPGTGDVKVGMHPDETEWSRGLTFTDGACYSEWSNAPDTARLAMLFIAFHTLTVRDGIDPQAAHKAFLAIDEYRRAIAPDVPGAAA